MKHYVFIIFILILFKHNVYSFSYFDKLNYSIGINSGLNRVENKAQIPLISNSTQCGIFDKGSNYGFNIGFQLLSKNPDYPFFPLLNLFYESRPVYLEQRNDNFEIYDPRLNHYVPLIRNFEYQGNFGYAGFNLGVAYEPFKNIPLGFQILFELSYPFISSNYKKFESIIAPEGLQYPGGVNNRVYESGELPAANLLSSGIAGIFFTFYNKYFLLKPSINYRYDINSLTSEFSWKSSSVKFELTISKEIDFSKEKTPFIPEESNQIEKVLYTERPKESIENRQFIRYFSGIPINILETIITQTYPLLPYIFFDSASTDLKSIYLNNNITSNFNENSLPKNTLGIYYQIFDLIGYRMNKNPQTTLILKGVTDGKELPDNEKRLELAEKRAENVKKYISNKWNIEESRVEVYVQDYPDLPTSDKYDEGFEENRRVEIYSKNFELLQPVIHSRFLEYTSNQKELLFYAGFEDSGLIKNFTIKFNSKDGEFYHYYSDEKTEGEIKIRLNSNLINLIADKVQDSEFMEVILKVELADGSSESITTMVKVNKSKNQFEIGRLNLIVFDFDKDQISETNRLMIDNFVKTSLADSSIVEITGSSDFLGPEKYNKDLSQRRADNTKKYLLDFNKDLDIKKCVGLGSEVLLYDNASPEGRFYCRTVKIEVKSNFVK